MDYVHLSASLPSCHSVAQSPTRNCGVDASFASSSSPLPRPHPAPREMVAQPSFFPSFALDQGACGLGAGIVSTLIMHPLDLLKVQQQVSTAPTGALAGAAVDTKGKGRVGALRGMYVSLSAIGRAEGVRGLYRGLTPNLVGNATSWGLYFVW